MHFDLSKNAGADERRGVILRRNTGLRALASGVSVLAVAGTVPALGVVALLATPAAAQEIQSGGGAGGNADPASGGGAGGAGGVAGGGGAGGHSVYGSAAIGGDGGAGALPGQPAQDGGKGDDDGRAFGGAGGQSGGTDLSAGGGGGGEAGHDDGNFADDGKDGGNGGSGSAHASTDVTLTGRTTGSNGISSVWAGAGGGGGAVVLTGSGSVATNDNLVIGGDGGTGHSGGGGGAGIVTVDGGDIWVIGGWVAGGAGGGGSYGGGQGGAGVFLHDGGLLDNTGTVAGGPGGGGGSRGGQGGVGALINDGTVINAARIIGGAGGDAYDGGVGGHGLMTYGGTITNQAGATITGGAGGASTMSTYVGGNAGAGVVFVDEANGGSLENFGAISGGAGGANTDTGTPGAGGVGVIVQDDNVTLVNSGTISGGLSGHAAAGQVRANALEIDGAGNTLEMHAGYGFEGNVVSSGAGNTLALGGAADSSFDVGTIGGSGQYQGFDAFEKTGTSTWVLTGTTTEKTPWTLNEGALIVGDGSHPGAGIAGTVTVENGATLGGAGTVGSTTIADGGILAPGNSIGTLTVDGDLALSSGSMLDYELGHPGSSAGAPGTSDRIDVAGDLTLDGTLDLADAGGAGFGYYRLMTYGGTLADNTLDIGATPSLADSAAYEIQPGGGNVDLLVAPRGSDTLQHWQGGDGTWGASNRNWLNIGKDAPPSGLPVTWAGNNAVFKNEPGGFNGGTILVVGTQNFKSLQFVDEGYRLEGSWTLRTVAGGSEIRVLADRAVIATDITGNGAIRKTEAGTLLLEGPNSYAGGTELLAGAVEVAEDASLGAASGGLTFNGGTLRVMETSFSETDRTIVWGGHGGGFDIADADNTFTVGQDLADGGDLHKKGAGTLVLQGTNSYGNTAVAAGALIGDADAISGSILNAGTITFNQAGNARFAGDIAGLNGTDGRMVKDGTGTLTLAGTSALDWTIRSGGLTTAAERFAGDAAIGANATFTLDQQADAQFAGTLSGAGAFDKTGAGTLLYTGDGSAFTGTTTVAGGLLNVGTRDDAAVLGGTIAMQAGARLGGFGTVGDTTLASGATVAPGNSIGTLTIDGDIAFDAGSTYEVETAPAGTDSDMIHATGTATLNGAGVAHSVLDGSAYDPFATYTILTADGGIDGTFGDITSSYAFLTPELFYGANSVDLELTRNDTDFAARARTFNQKAAARGIESLGQGNALYNAVAVLPDDKAMIRGSFDALSGEIHASAKTALIEDSRFVRDAVNERIRAAFGAAATPAMPVMAFGPGDPRPTAPESIGPVAWGEIYGTWGETDGDGNAAKLDRASGGFLTGIDGAITQNIRLGLVAGYGHSAFDVDERAASGSSDNVHLGLYGGGRWDALRLSGGLAYTWHAIETNRAAAFSGFADNLSADYTAATFQAFGEAGYRIETAATTVEPFAGLAHVSLRTNAFAEEGGAAALLAADRTTATTFATLGVHASRDFDLRGMSATAHSTLVWRQAFGDTVPLSTHAFAGGDTFTIAGVPIAKDAAIIEAGLELDMTDNATLGVSYSGQIARDAQDHGFGANLAVRF